VNDLLFLSMQDTTIKVEQYSCKLTTYYQYYNYLKLI